MLDEWEVRLYAIIPFFMEAMLLPHVGGGPLQYVGEEGHG